MSIVMTNERRLIVTFCQGALYESMGEITHPRMASYAKACQADFVRVGKGLRDYPVPHYGKTGIAELFQRYERILFLDTDILVSQIAPDIFEEVKGDFCAYPEGRLFQDGRTQTMLNFLSVLYGLQTGPRLYHEWSGLEIPYFNTGVMLMKQHHEPLFSLPPRLIASFGEQTWINWQLALHSKFFSFTPLGWEWNCMPCVEAKTKNFRREAHFIHYAGMAQEGEGVIRAILDDEWHWKREGR